MLLSSRRQNEVMRMLAAWAAMLAVPTAIAGIYGMNFEHMPELTWRYGYFVVIGAIALICSFLYWRFKKAGWL
jgi:magnesium transporter